MNEGKFMSVDELAAYLNVHRNMVNYWVTEKMIPHIKVGKLIRFDRDKIASWLKSNSQERR